MLKIIATCIKFISQTAASYTVIATSSNALVFLDLFGYSARWVTTNLPCNPHLHCKMSAMFPFVRIAALKNVKLGNKLRRAGLLLLANILIFLFFKGVLIIMLNALDIDRKLFMPVLIFTSSFLSSMIIYNYMNKTIRYELVFVNSLIAAFLCMLLCFALETLYANIQSIVEELLSLTVSSIYCVHQVFKLGNDSFYQKIPATGPVSAPDLELKRFKFHLPNTFFADRQDGNNSQQTPFGDSHSGPTAQPTASTRPNTTSDTTLEENRWSRVAYHNRRPREDHASLDDKDLNIIKLEFERKCNRDSEILYDEYGTRSPTEAKSMLEEKIKDCRNEFKDLRESDNRSKIRYIREIEEAKGVIREISRSSENKDKLQDYINQRESREKGN